MLTKDKRDAIRARCMASMSLGGNLDMLRDLILKHSAKFMLPANEKQKGTLDFILHAFQDVPALLDALDELETERDCWKTRAEALERFIKPSVKSCDCCVSIYNCGGPVFDDNHTCKNWQFDQARFAEPERTGGDDNGNAV